MFLKVIIYIIIVTVATTLIKFNPRLDKIDGRWIVWYSRSWADTTREYFFVDEIFNKF